MRLWLAGEGIGATEWLVGFDRETVRRYVEVAVGLSLVRDGGDEQLSDVFIGVVVEAVRPHRTDDHGEAWRLMQVNHEVIAAWLADDLTKQVRHSTGVDAGAARRARHARRHGAARHLGR